METTTTQTEALLTAAHLTCRSTGIDCQVPHCLSCDGRGDHCEDCSDGRATCECGGVAVRFENFQTEVIGAGGAVVMGTCRNPLCVRCCRVAVGLIGPLTGFEEDPDAPPVFPKCWLCDWAPAPGKDWAEVPNPSGAYATENCAHISGLRECTCCSTVWFRCGNDYDWDIDGCAHENCPECAAWLASIEGIAEMARQRAEREVA